MLAFIKIQAQHNSHSRERQEDKNTHEPGTAIGALNHSEQTHESTEPLYIECRSDLRIFPVYVGAIHFLTPTYSSLKSVVEDVGGPQPSAAQPFDLAQGERGEDRCYKSFRIAI